jgi:heparin binding hemagglutinin HbhA
MTTPTQTKNRTIPAPFYAAAGAADFAYEKLRDLQTRLAEQRGKNVGRELDIERLREMARRNAAAFVAGAHTAQEKAVALYTDLVARGEKVVKGGAHATESVAGEIAATADADAKVPAKPVKRTAAAK